MIRLSTSKTFGSIAPYIGLVGTVLGIMQAYSAIGKTGPARLGIVVPAILASLGFTTFGLLVAAIVIIVFRLFGGRRGGRP